MQIIVTSKNPVKIAAVQNAFEQAFADTAFTLVSCSVPSGVPEQPMGEEQTRCGAENRVYEAQKTYPEAEYWVGLEGGADEQNGQLVTFAWMYIRHRDGRVSQTRTGSVPLPPSIQRLMASGMELGQANDQVFNTRNSKHQGGAIGLLTEGRYTRQSVYTQALIMALLPFSHPLYR